MQSLIAQSQTNENLKPSEKALIQCSWTNLVRLLSISSGFTGLMTLAQTGFYRIVAYTSTIISSYIFYTTP